MTTRGEEFLGCLGNGKSDRELDNELEDLELDEEWDEVIPANDLFKYPVVKRYIKKGDDLKALNDKIKENKKWIKKKEKNIIKDQR